MNNDDIARRKFDLLMQAVEQVNHQDEAMAELRDAAFEVLLLNPGCEQSDWAKILVEQYGTEVVDALGNNPMEVLAELEDLWETPYLDENSGLERTYETWAKAFANEDAVQLYYDLIKQQ